MENLGLSVAYLAVAEGAPVYNPSGGKVGTVQHVVADEASDVFHGLMVKTDSGDQPHLFADREQVSGLYERGVQLAVAADQLHRPTDDAVTAAATDEPAGDRLQAGIRKAWDWLSCHGCVGVRGVDVEVLRSVPDATLSRLRRYAHLPDSFHAMHTGNSAFEVPGVDGVIIYRPGGRFMFQFGGVFAAPDRQAELLHAFMRRAAEGRRRVVSVQLLREDVDPYIRAGFAVNQLGVSYARSLTGGFSLSGKHMAKIRNKVSRAVREGIVVHELADVAERPPQVMAGLDEVDRSWLKGKGFGAVELDFMIGERGGPADQLCRLFVAEHERSIVGYQTFSPVFGRHAGWLLDISRRALTAPPGTSDLILSTAIRHFVDEHVPYLHFGLTPFTGIDPKHWVEGRSPLCDRIVHWLSTRGSFVYPAQSQVAYKLKWRPDLTQPEYIAFQGGLSLRAVWRLLRVTKAVSLPFGPGAVPGALSGRTSDGPGAYLVRSARRLRLSGSPRVRFRRSTGARLRR